MKHQLLVVALGALALGACKDDKPRTDPAPAPARDAAAPPRAEDLQVSSPTLEIGSTISRTEDSRMTMKIGPDEIEETEKQVSTAKVMAVMPPAAAKLEIHYQTHDITRRAGAQQEATPSPLAGKTYVIWAENGTLQATTPDGKKVSDAEHELLASEHLELGKVPQIEQLLRARRWNLNEKVDLTGDELRSLGEARAGGDESIQPVSGSLTWTGRTGDLATFEGEMTVLKDDDRAHIESTVKSTITVDLTAGRVSGMVTTGSMKGEVKGDPPQPIEGTLENRSTTQYGR